MKKPVIGISSEVLDLGLDFRESYKLNVVNQDYKNLVEARGGLPIILPVSKNLDLVDGYLDICDGLVFTGGADINPICYGEEADPSLGMTDYSRDLFELALMEGAIERDLPVLAICRGMQILNVVRGGSLVQHIPDQEASLNHSFLGRRADPAHEVLFEDASLFSQVFGREAYVNSSHHQGLKDLGQGIRVLGRARDGQIEAVGLEGANFIYGVQWHPEEMVARDPRSYGLIDRFLKAVVQDEDPKGKLPL